jgi:4-hydroxythreonine-4-phosphate dehydrogenase
MQSNFVFMLTKADKTVANPIEFLNALGSIPVRNIGIKDAGVAPELLVTVLRKIIEKGKRAYLEIMSDVESDWLHCAAAAKLAGATAILGTRRSEKLDEMLIASKLHYFPVVDNPTAYARTLEGDYSVVENLARRACDAEHVTGVLLNPYRIACTPESLIAAVKRSTGKPVFVTGTIHTLDRINALQKISVDNFAIGTSIFEKLFVQGDVREQLNAIEQQLTLKIRQKNVIE